MSVMTTYDYERRIVELGKDVHQLTADNHRLHAIIQRHEAHLTRNGLPPVDYLLMEVPFLFRYKGKPPQADAPNTSRIAADAHP